MALILKKKKEGWDATKKETKFKPMAFFHFVIILLNRYIPTKQMVWMFNCIQDFRWLFNVKVAILEEKYW